MNVYISKREYSQPKVKHDCISFQMANLSKILCSPLPHNPMPHTHTHTHTHTHISRRRKVLSLECSSLECTHSSKKCCQVFLQGWSRSSLLLMLTLVLLNQDIPCLCKLCRSRSVGFFTVCHSVCEFISATWIK